MSKLQPVRGTRDIFGDDMRRFSHVVRIFERLAQAYGFDEISTPIFEFTEVYKRTLGETSDVVTKEMYTFEDRSGDLLTLRPEYTAGIARAYMSGGMAQAGVSRLFGWGPMFRHERPQKGRFRQFHQLDAEIIGAAEPAADVDLLALAWQLLSDLGISDRIVLHLNSLGDQESRLAYRAALTAYFADHVDALSEDSRMRLQKNPMRILDSKDPGDRALLPDAPQIADYLNERSRAFFETVCAGVKSLGIPYIHDQRLVRGLDYYSHTAFEFVTDALGSQGTVLGGGRYDGLIEMMGGPSTPGVGWAAGIERLAMLIDEPPAPMRAVALIPMGDAAEKQALVLARDLRAAGLRTLMDYKGNMKKRLNRAAKADARLALIIGDEEVARGAVVVRDLDHSTQKDCALWAVHDQVRMMLAAPPIADISPAASRDVIDAEQP
ncbi:histidine--tRNA ligase [Iodidimonas nitroreducens]|uniref:Histidine--tRNA ligase n=1 Tax=Iodidimonas nitroreducens TaxID=1236968 RepID=A0A5A7NCV0_9PROT|nr:histidine--tRNA ligase [Iodidimonas nitroreducens]GAK34187.1 histidine--tRNA ligase [alpha proteobacterium Q-1]GER05310.1 histidine--tRNA ligase [Iodidimonas nitroreducens]